MRKFVLGWFLSVNSGCLFVHNLVSMINQRSSTAVLLFSLPTALDATRKGLAGPQMDRNRALWGTMHQLTVAKVRAAGLTCIRSGSVVPTPDYSASFGEQIKTAVSATLALGYERVIVIGNDCPDLRVNDLHAAADALTHGQLPVGYDQRGGVFLFGLDRRFLTDGSIPEIGSFQELPWQTGQLGLALTQYLNQAFGQVVCLSAMRADWNEQADIRAGNWLLGAFAGLAHCVWTLVNGNFNTFARPELHLYVTSPGTLCLRAPPVAA